VAVADGDTITVLDSARTRHRVRLAGIDAPESSQDFGQASKKNLSGLVFGKVVEVSYAKLDRYGRVLGIVRLGGRDINLAQIEAGLAWHYKEYADEQTAEDRESYAEAENRARRDRAGLWQQPDPVKPSEFRRSKNN
jgi:endonuclease YncB( thermonuclease family)